MVVSKVETPGTKSYDCSADPYSVDERERPFAMIAEVVVGIAEASARSGMMPTAMACWTPGLYASWKRMGPTISAEARECMRPMHTRR